MTQTLATQPSVSTAAAARTIAEPAGIEPRSAAETRAALIGNGLLALFGIIFLAPLAWLFFASVDANASWALSWPQFTLDNFRAVTRGDFLDALFNTFLLSLVATAVSTVTATFGGYALSRRRIPFSDELMVAILFLTGIPVAIMIIPVFQVYAKYNLLNLWATGVFLGVSSLPFALWLIKTAMDAVPKELEGSRQDGAGKPLAGHLARHRAGRTPRHLLCHDLQLYQCLGFVSAAARADQRSEPDHRGRSKSSASSVPPMSATGRSLAYSIVYSIPVVILYVLVSKPFSGGFSMGGAVKG